MTIGVRSSALFGDMFGTAAMRAVFGELAFLARCAEVEAALARAQARIGIVPEEAAGAISAAAASVAANPASLDLARLQRETETVGYPILPLVRQLAHQGQDRIADRLGLALEARKVERCRVRRDRSRGRGDRTGGLFRHDADAGLGARERRLDLGAAREKGKLAEHRAHRRGA